MARESRAGQERSPGEISGLMTLGEAASRLGIDMPGMRNLLDLKPDVPESTRLVDLEDIDETLTLHALRKLLTVQHQVLE
jgi:hypothetical protein